MIIGIDYRFAISSTRGIGRYIKQIVDRLITIDSTNSYLLYVDRDVDLNLPANFKLRKIKGNLVLFEQLLLPQQAKKDQVDLLWYPSNSGPIFLNKSIKLVVTVHDLAFVKNWKFNFSIFSSRKRFRFALAELYRSLALQLGLNRINKFITVSNYSAKELLSRFDVTALVLPNQIGLLETSDNDNLLHQFGIQPKNYIYTLTGEAPQKGLANYIELFRNRVIDRPLVISGVYDEDIMQKYSAKNIIFTGYLTDKERNTLYAHAYCFLFLSLNEGFGLPLLEAMYYQLPIICANKGALPEIGGPAVLLVEPNDHAQIEMLLNDLLAFLPSNLAELQRKQLCKYNDWSTAATTHLNLFEQIGSA